MPPTPPPSVKAESAQPSAATLAAHQAVAETLRVSTETPPETKRRRALEHLAECGFAPSHGSTAAILCSFGQSSEPIAKAWLRDIKASSDRDLIDDFATGFFSLAPDLRGLKLLNLASSTNELALQSRLEALKPGVNVDDEGPADLASTVSIAKEVFTAKPTERHRVTRRSRIRASQWSRLQHRWRKGRAMLRSSSGPPHWIFPTAIANTIRQSSREETTEEKQGANGTTIAIFIAIFVLIKIFSALGRSSANKTPTYESPNSSNYRNQGYQENSDLDESIRRLSETLDRVRTPRGEREAGVGVPMDEYEIDFPGVYDFGPTIPEVPESLLHESNGDVPQRYEPRGIDAFLTPPPAPVLKAPDMAPSNDPNLEIDF